MKKPISDIYILGTKYKIIMLKKKDDYMKYTNADGYCDTSSKEIVLLNFTNKNSWYSNHKQELYKTIRHEIIHAFLYESGLDANSKDTDSWATNEEMVDWLAIQFPKIQEVIDKL